MAKHFTYSKGIVYTPILHDAVGLSDPNPMTELSISQIVAGARGVGFEITGTGITTRSAVFTVTVSYDGGTNFRAYSMLISNATNTNDQTLTRVASITQNATGTTVCWMTPETLTGITHIKTSLVITDSGTPAGSFTVRAVITY
jgi:hypothetical protein